MDISDAALESCNTYHMDHLCEHLHVTTDVQELNCAIAIYMDSVQTFNLQPSSIQHNIKRKCRFTYHEVLHPTPTTLQTQDEILFANFPSEHWQLICDEVTDRPSFMKGALYTIINLQDLCTCGILTAEGRFLYESMRSCKNPDTRVTLHFTYNRALVNYDSTITAQDSKRYASKPYPFQAPDLQYYEHQPYVTLNDTLRTRVKRHVPDSQSYEQAMAAQQFPLSQAVHKMETQEPIYVGPILPASPHDDGLADDDSFVRKNTPTPSQENESVQTMDKPISNFLFNVVTLINTLLHMCLLIFMRLSFRPGGFFYNTVLNIVQMLVVKPTTAVRLMESLIPTPTPTIKTYFILDEPILEPTDKTPPDSFEQMSFMASFSKMVLIFLIICGTLLILWAIFKFLLLPLCFRSNTCRQICMSCIYNSQTRSPPTADIFLDVVHIYSGKQIRIYLTTITAPAIALGFTGSVKLKNFKLRPKKFTIFVDIDWHNCLLLYNNFIIPLPERGTALPFQPNLLTDFTQQGPFNIVILAQHLDTLLQIPHIDHHDFMSSDDKLDFAIESPYKKIHDVVKRLMPLAPSVSATPNPSMNLADDISNG